MTNSALHRAVHVGNQRSIDYLLEFTAKINFNSSKSFKDIFYKLVEQANFP